MKFVDLPDRWLAVQDDEFGDDSFTCRKCQIRRNRAGVAGWFFQGRDDNSFQESALWFEIVGRWPKYWYLCGRCHARRNETLSVSECQEAIRKREADTQLIQYMLRCRFRRAARGVFELVADNQQGSTETMSAANEGTPPIIKARPLPWDDS